MAFCPKNLEIWVHSHEYSRPIQTATYPPVHEGNMGPQLRGPHVGDREGMGHPVHIQCFQG